MPKGVYERKSVEERFWERVSKTEGCWLWTGFIQPQGGYGQLTVNNRTSMAHRVAYSLLKHPLLVGEHVRHLCNNPRCVNPEHLEAGSHKENMQDRKSAGKYGGKYCGARIPFETVEEIRRRHIPNVYGCQRLAREFGVSPSQIKNILNGSQRVAA